MNPIDLDKARPGMTLAKAVHTLQDVLLLKSGVQLTEKNIHILKSWGIRQIWIDAAAGEGTAGHMDPEQGLRATIDDALRVKFSETLSDPLMEEILRIAGNILEKRLMNKEIKHGAQKS